MHLEELGLPLSRLKGVGPASQRTLNSIGVRTIRDFLWHLPREYQDRTIRVPFAAARLHGNDHKRGPELLSENEHEHAGVWVNTIATVVRHDFFGTGTHKTLKVIVQDDSAEAVLVCFGRAFLSAQLKPGMLIAVCGNAQYRFREIQLGAFEFEAVGPPDLPDSETVRFRASSSFDRILPVYPLSGELTQAFFRKTLTLCMQDYGRLMDEMLPPSLMERHHFIERAAAFGALHHPENRHDIDEGRRRLVYEELLLLQMQVAHRTLERRRSFITTATIPVPQNIEQTVWPPLVAALRDSLPFALTPGQTSAVDEILADIDRPWPLSRLIQGDVGSGKTLVALLAACAVIGRGGQAALMVPTVLLARQHAEKAASLLEPLGIRVALIAGLISAASRRPLLNALAQGEIQLVIGTHALFGAEVQFKQLDLAIIDEQHRFGVLQRQALHLKAHRPNLLMMSATPIPQTLALTVFGDMDTSSIRMLPAHRKPIETHLARMGNEQKVYEWVRREIAAGHQAYFVYPLIDEIGSDLSEDEDDSNDIESAASDKNRSLKNAEAMFRTLAGDVFPECTVGMIHSRMSEESKESVMDQFVRGEMHILVATSVVEVGVDVPNATCMVIEHAERFGLSALHQLRGRVGRGSAQSWCFLVYQEPLTEVAKRRLKILKESTDGFLIAEEDLAIRGPGDIKGIQQSGFMRLKIADLSRDMAVMNTARADAFALLEADPELTEPAHAGLKRILELSTE